MKHINKTTDEYKQLVKQQQPPRMKTLNFIKAYLVGGLICVIGQGFWQLYMFFNIARDDAGTLSTITMLFLGGLVTGLGYYDELSQFAGAGSSVPVTGFSNAMVSPAMEHKQEGLILGVGANMFTVAGPVLTYGLVSAFIIGVLKIVSGS